MTNHFAATKLKWNVTLTHTKLSNPHSVLSIRHPCEFSLTPVQMGHSLTIITWLNSVLIYLSIEVTKFSAHIIFDRGLNSLLLEWNLAGLTSGAFTYTSGLCELFKGLKVPFFVIFKTRVPSGICFFFYWTNYVTRKRLRKKHRTPWKTAANFHSVSRGSASHCWWLVQTTTTKNKFI